MNLDFCPNKKSKEFQEMSGIFGEDKAYFLWMRNKGNHLEKAPNGADSKLFRDLLEYFKGNRAEALKAKAKVYTNEFINWFGDWGKFKTMDTKNNLFTPTGEVNWDYFEQLLDQYHNNQPDSMFSHGRYTLATRPENHFTGEKNTLNHIKFVTQSMLNLLEGKYDIDLPFVSEARASMQNQKDLMIIAAMFHDVAKPYRHGDIHGWESADILRDLLGIDYNNRVAEWAVRHHMPMPFSHKAEFSLSNPEAIEVAKNIARDARRIGIDANTAINAFVLINAADVINGRELNVDDNWAKKAGEEGLKKYGGDISVKNVLSVELKEKVALLKKAFDEIKDEDLGDTAYNYSHQERFDYNAFPEGGREDRKLPYLNNKESQPSTQQFVNHSGGANGSDMYWGQIGEKYGVTSNHYYYNEKTPYGNKEISQQDYEEGRQESAKAAAYNYDYKYATMKDSRLIRNWAQVKYADAIFAIGHLVKPGEKLFPNIPGDTRVAKNVAVTGGTGYAVAMAILHNKPVYVFDQERGKWYKHVDGKWSESDVPTLTTNFAGIGTRNITKAGIQAIEDVYAKTFNISQQPTQSQNIPSTDTKINIYAGTGENADLSNFAERPVDVSKGEVSDVLHKYVGKAFKAKFRTVEGAFQAMKIFFSSEDYTELYIPQGGLPTIGITKKGDQMLTKFENASGSQARSLGRQISGLDKDKWDKVSSIIMKALIKASFEQNPQALQRLLATGNATLTHTQDKGKWGTEFPKLLMEVREELNLNNAGSKIILTEEQRKEAEEIKKQCKGE